MSTPRTDQIKTANKFPRSTEYYEIVVHARALERELTALTADRDQLRSEVEDLKARITQDHGIVELMEAELKDLKSAGGPPFIRSEAIRNLRDQVCGLKASAERAEAELAVERARMDDLVADLNDACITLASAKDDCDDYALLNTGFKLTAVRDVLLQYIPNAAMKEGAK